MYKCSQIIHLDIIKRHWEAISQAILAALPPTSYPDLAVSNNILEAILLEKMQLWIIARRIDGKLDIGAIATTMISKEEVSGVKNLVIYSLYGYDRLPTEAWQSGMDALKAFAKEQKCYKIIAYSTVPRVFEISQKIGMKQEAVVLTAEV